MTQRDRRARARRPRQRLAQIGSRRQGQRGAGRAGRLSHLAIPNSSSTPHRRRRRARSARATRCGRNSPPSCERCASQHPAALASRPKRSSIRRGLERRAERAEAPRSARRTSLQSAHRDRRRRVVAVSIGSPMRTVTWTGRTIALPFRIAARPPMMATGTIGAPAPKRHHEAALLERQQFVGAAARAFRKNQKRVAGANRRRGRARSTQTRRRGCRARPRRSPRPRTRGQAPESCPAPPCRGCAGAGAAPWNSTGGSTLL